MRDRSRPLLKSFLGCLFWVAVAWVPGPARVSAESGAQWDLTTSSSSESSTEQTSSDSGAISSEASSVDGEPTSAPTPTPSCDADGDGDRAVGECGGKDCDDNDPSVSSLKKEGWNGSYDTSFDGKDNNCSGAVDCADENCKSAISYSENRMCCGSGDPVKLMTDPDNCGNCGIKCGEGQACIFGRCGVPETPPKQVECQPISISPEALEKALPLDELAEFLKGPPPLRALEGEVCLWYEKAFDQDGNEVFPPKKPLFVGVILPVDRTPLAPMFGKIWELLFPNKRP